jgi:hypothetical protein
MTVNVPNIPDDPVVKKYSQVRLADSPDNSREMQMRGVLKSLDIS